MYIVFFSCGAGSWNTIGNCNTILDACMLYLDMYRGIRIRDGLYLVEQNPGWVLSCKAESWITGFPGISTGLHCT